MGALQGQIMSTYTLSLDREMPDMFVLLGVGLGIESSNKLYAVLARQQGEDVVVHALCAENLDTLIALGLQGALSPEEWDWDLNASVLIDVRRVLDEKPAPTFLIRWLQGGIRPMEEDSEPIAAPLASHVLEGKSPYFVAVCDIANATPEHTVSHGFPDGKDYVARRARAACANSHLRLQ
jgi:hypothetical protein